MAGPQPYQTLFERLGWKAATRNDRAVAQIVASGDEVDAVCTLEAEGLLDSFVQFLRSIGVLEKIEGFTVEAIQRERIPTPLLLLTYLVKALMGVPSMNAVPDLLFSHEGFMNLLGFNAYFNEHGPCQRGAFRRKPEKAAPRPMCAQTLGNFVAKIAAKEAEDLFNGIIRCLVTAGIFAREVVAILDATDIVTTPKCRGAGRVVRQKKMRDKTGKEHHISVLVYGFKLGVLYDRRTGIPVAAKIVTIQQHESTLTLALVEQAQKNLQDHGRLVKLLEDRGFLDGPTLYDLDRQGIVFVVPARENLQVAKDARGLAQQGSGVSERRVRVVTHGYGQKRHKEELLTEVVGIANLQTFDTYNDLESAKRRNRRDYTPVPINTVVVRVWDNKDFGPCGKVVFLTNGPVDEPLTVFDDYDDRSCIENGLFREGKQGWMLEAAPRKTEGAVRAHVLLTLITLSLTRAYQIQQQREEQQDAATDPVIQGIRTWRRQRRNENRDRVIVFAGDHYALFHVAEFSVLSGIRLKELPPHLGTRQDIFRRFGLEP
jgi:hypothetical protein